METTRLLSPGRKRPPLLSVPSTTSFRSSVSLDPTLQHHDLREHQLNQNYRRPLDRAAYWAYYVPVMRWAPQYRISALAGDFFAGMSLASFQVPLVMSYATSLAKLPPLVGLYSVVAAACVYAVLGGVPTLVVGPSPSTAVLYGSAIHALQESGFHMSAVQVSAVLSVAMGAVLLAAGLLRYGFLARVLSRALLKGFIGAMGVIMIVNQLDIQMGVAPAPPGVVPKVRYAISHVSDLHGPTVAVSAGTLLVVLAVRHVKMHLVRRGVTWAVYVPELLAMVVGATLFSYVWDWQSLGIAIVGDLVNTGPGHGSIFVSPFTAATVPLLRQAFSTSLLCSILGFFDSTTASKALSAKYNYAVSANRELIALGVANLAVSLVGGMPSFGALGRSKINILAGAVSPLSSVFMAAAVLLGIRYLLPCLHYLPECTLSMSTTIIGITVLEEVPQDVRFFWQIGGYDELAVLATVFAATLLWSVETGVVLGISIAVMRLIRHSTRSHIHLLGRIANTGAFRNADEFIEESFVIEETSDPEGGTDAQVAEIEHTEGVLIVRIPEPLTFANIGDLRTRLTRLEKFRSLSVHPSQPSVEGGQCRAIVFDCKGMTSLDAAATQELYEIVRHYTDQFHVAFSRVSTDRAVRDMLRRSGISAMVNARMEDTSPPSSSGLGPGFFLSIEDALSQALSRNLASAHSRA